MSRSLVFAVGFLFFSSIAFGQDLFQDFIIADTVPEGAVDSLIAPRANTECGQCGIVAPIDITISHLSYVEAGGTNRISDPNFKGGCGVNPEARPGTTFEPAESGDGRQLHLTGLYPFVVNCPNQAYPVTPGAAYTATIRARVSRSSVGTGYFAVIFRAAPGSKFCTNAACEIRRDLVGFRSTFSGIALTQNGFTVQAIAQGGAPPPRTFSILNATGQPLNFTATASTITGANWLSVSPAAGRSDPTMTPAVVTVSVSPANLDPGTYYGQIRVDAPGAPNSPQTVTIVVTVARAGTIIGPIVEPAGLIFAAAQDTNPAAQQLRITNLAAQPVAFNVTGTFSTPETWYSFSPASGSVAPNQPATVAVQPNVAGLAPGVYDGQLRFEFANNTVTTVRLVLVVTASGSVPVSALGAAATCSPARLLPVFTLLGPSFTAAVAWPSAIEAKIVDDCGQPLLDGSAVVSFSNGDEPLSLLPSGGGRWSATWAPTRPASGPVKLTLTAVSRDLKQQGSVAQTGGLMNNPKVPVVTRGGVVNSASFAASASPSPGELISIFGANFADGTETATSYPLRTEMLGVSIVLGGQNLPLVAVTPSQVNAIVPYTVPSGAQQIVVSRGGAISIPQAVPINAAEPGIFSTNLSGSGQAHVYVIRPDGSQVLADANNPAKAGDALVIYCSGLGSVTPSADPANATPADQLRNTVTPAALTIGGVPAQVFFSGLTPGLSGLYQVNAYMPAGVMPGPEVPIVLSEAGFGGPQVTLAVAAQ